MEIILVKYQIQLELSITRSHYPSLVNEKNETQSFYVVF